MKKKKPDCFGRTDRTLNPLGHSSQTASSHASHLNSLLIHFPIDQFSRYCLLYLRVFSSSSTFSSLSYTDYTRSSWTFSSLVLFFQILLSLAS